MLEYREKYQGTTQGRRKNLYGSRRYSRHDGEGEHAGHYVCEDSEVFVQKRRPKKGSNGRFLNFVIIVLVIVLICVTGSFIWKVIHPKEKEGFYFLQINAHRDYATAEQEAKQLQMAGGGGYILKTDTYRVLAAVYRSKKDCEKVCERLKEQYPHCTVLELTPGDVWEKKISEQLLDCIDRIYSMNNEYDQSKLDRDECIGALQTEVNWLTVFREENAEYSRILGEYINRVQYIIDSVYGENLSAKMRHATIALAVLYVKG